MNADTNTGLLEPCHAVNPELWFDYCRTVGRYPAPADHWTEYDVIAALRARRDREAFINAAITL